MGEMRVMLYGETGEKPPKEEESRVLANEAAKSKLLAHMCTQVEPLGFEARGGCAPARAPARDARGAGAWGQRRAVG